MRFSKDDFIDYMGFREAAMEEKIEECLSAARMGESTAYIERDDLTDDEVRYIQKEVQRRIENE